MDLKSKKCVPCEGGAKPLERSRADELMRELKGWEPDESRRSLHKRLRFRDFAQTMAFVNRVAALAEAEGHHPDLGIHYNVLDVNLSTHAIGGLSENDFILAAKIDGLTT
jgi:4a-hydroxytetrahydrobiopterin dehydratase